MKFINGFYLGLTLFSVSIIQNSCSIIESDSSIASYIHIDSVSLRTDYPTQGSNSKKVTDVWIVYDNEYLGTFPLPADIPLIGEGLHNIKVKAGILENGISGTRSAYVKYSTFDTTLELSSTNKPTFSPVVSYGEAIEFPQIEDFDDASLSLVPTTNGNVTLNITASLDTNSFEGNSGLAILDANHTIFEVATSTPFTLPLNVPSYVELDYKGDLDFEVGVFITTQSGILKTSMLAVRASASWKKIYINMSNLNGVAPDGINYKIYLRAVKSSAVSVANLYFDNLKVVY
jgi:hypothetical protein